MESICLESKIHLHKVPDARTGIGQILGNKFVLKGSQKQFKAVLRTCVSEKMRCRCGSSDVVECLPIYGEFVFGRTSSTGGGKVFVVGGLRRSGGHGAKSVWMQICIRYCFWWCFWMFYCSEEFVHHGNSFKGKCFRILVAGAAPEPV